MTRKQRLALIAIVIFIALMGIGALASLYTDWLWFNSLQFKTVFWRMIRARFAAGVFFGAQALLLVGINLWIAGRFTQQALRLDSPWKEGEMPGEALLRSRYSYLAAATALILFMAHIGAGQGLSWLRYTNSQPFGVTDPIFGRDVGFYVFSLPLYQFMVNFLLGGLIAIGLVVGLIYIAGGGIRLQERIEILPQPRAHLSVLGGLLMLVIAWNYRLKIYELLYSQGQIAFGASYVDVIIERWAYWLLVFICLGAAALFFMNTRRLGARLPLLGTGLLVGGSIVVGTIPATLVQKLVVEPSELARETPYIQHNIQATRHAFGLDRIEEHPFEATEDLTWADIEANPLTIRNVRIWDERPLARTYQQVQEIRSYYVFPDIDVDRYTIDGVYRQVMLAAREMVTSRLPAQASNWVNKRLKYTHGYGVALSPVNQVTPEGLPTLLVKDIPPVSVPGLEIERPEIYYGEWTAGYVLVKTSTQEFDYPKGDDNEFTTYQGTGGVSIGGFFDRLAFAVRFSDINLLLSNYITDESRIMFQRQIRQRVSKIAPFLQYDHDPYLVVAAGKLYWIIDAYTTTDMYPYSTRGGRDNINYIRNSVKVVVDIYNGSVSFYRMDLQDPLVDAYAKIFPDLFRDLKEIPQELRAHLRYPKDLFKLQATLYLSYHMNDVQLFYNQEDLWEVPNEIYSNRAQVMAPYYIIVKLPGEKREEFLLMMPLTPAKKDNMISWLAARCDGENYGDLLVYRLPKDRLIYGPMQLEARIDQQPEISSKLTLWGQRGSEVIRGNLMVIPIESSFLYVEPIYLQARQERDDSGVQGGQGTNGGDQWQQSPRRDVRGAAIPELKQVIVGFGGQVIMRDTFEEALVDLFGKTADEVAALSQTEPPPSTDLDTTVRSAAQIAAAAEAHYQRVRASLQEWDWAQAGEEMAALEKTITELRKTLELEQ